MKKILLIALASLLAFTFISCSGDTPNTPDEKSNFPPVPKALWGKWEQKDLGDYYVISEYDIIYYSNKNVKPGTSLFSLYNELGGRGDTTQDPNSESYNTYTILKQFTSNGGYYYFNAPSMENGKKSITILDYNAETKTETKLSYTYIEEIEI